MDPGWLAGAIEAAAPGATIQVPPGTFRGPLFIRRSVTLKGAGPLATAISGGDGHPVISVLGEKATFRASGLTIRDGKAPLGGGLRVTADGATVALEDVVFTGNRAAKAGGAVHLEAGRTTIRKALLQTNAAPLGGAISVDGTAALALADVVIEDNDAHEAGGIILREAAALELDEVYIRRNGARRGASGLEARGTRSRAPKVVLRGGAIAGGSPAVLLIPAPGAEPKPTLQATRASVPGALRETPGFADGGGNTFV